MANLPETPDYPAGVYQLETSDPVLGGPGGISNRQAEQLANRTAWLKAKVDAFIDGTVAVLKATKLATARTLSISGAGSGSASFDGSANANIALTLADSGVVAGTYPKVTVNAKGVVTGGSALSATDIPANLALPGNPTGPTAAQFDNDLSLATTEFVQRALGSFAGAVAYSSANVVLTAADIGKAVVVSVASTVTLPAASTAVLGATLFISATGPGDVTLVRAGTDTIIRNDAVSGSAFVIRAGTSVRLRQGNAAASWYVVDGDGALQFSSLFGSSVSPNGFKKYPDANSPTGYIIEQWGTFSGAGATAHNVSFPVAFPNACLNVELTSWNNSLAAGTVGQIAWLTNQGDASYSTDGYHTAGFRSFTNTSSAVGLKFKAIGY